MTEEKNKQQAEIKKTEELDVEDLEKVVGGYGEPQGRKPLDKERATYLPEL